MQSQKDIRKRMLEINSNPELSSDNKRKLCQEVMTGKMNTIHMCIQINQGNHANNCEHFTTGVKQCSQFKFDCCNTVYPCKKCHKNKCDKSPLISTISCLNCNLEQEPSNVCIRCNIQFSKNYCNKCRIWTDKNIRHCESCGCCRVIHEDAPPDLQLYHCHVCNMCSYDKQSHICVGYNLKEQNCSVCDVSVYNSILSNYILPCKHILHADCVNKMLTHNQFKCPICRKSMIDMNINWMQIRNSIISQPMTNCNFPLNIGDMAISPNGQFLINDKLIKNGKSYCSGNLILESQIIPTIFLESSLQKDLSTEIYCNDCNTESIQDFHFLGLECVNCGSFNTHKK